MFFTDTVLFCFFLNKLEICGNPALSKSISPVFQQHFLTLCLCHIFVILKKYRVFRLLVMEIFVSHLHHYCCKCFVASLHPRKAVNLTRNVCSDCFNRLFPISFLFFRPSHCLTHSTRPINNLIAASSVFKRKEELVTHLTLNQKVEMIKLSEEGMLKAGVGWKLGLLHQTAKLWMWTKRMWWKLKMLLWWIQEWEKSETALLLIRRKF